MALAPPVIDHHADLVTAARQMASQDARRLLVTDGESIVGVIREQDLFFEFTHLMREYEQYLP